MEKEFESVGYRLVEVDAEEEDDEPSPMELESLEGLAEDEEKD